MPKEPPLYPHVPKSKKQTPGVARTDVQAAMSQLGRVVSDLMDIKDKIRGFADKPATPETREQLRTLHEQANKRQSEVDEMFGVTKSLVYLY